MRAVQYMYLALCVLALITALAKPAKAEDRPATVPAEAPRSNPPKIDAVKPKDEDPKPSDANKKDAHAAGEAVEVDPTEMSDALKNAANPPAAKAPNVPHTAAPPTPVLPPLPDIVLKAFVEAEGKTPSALLEINGKMQQLVSEGMEFSVHGGEKQYLTLKVKKVARDGVEIEVVQLKQTIRLK